MRSRRRRERAGACRVGCAARCRTRRCQMPLDVAPPRVVIDHGLRARCGRAPRTPAATAARNTTAFTNSSTSPGVHSTARSLVTRLAARSVGAQRRRQHFAELLEVAADDAAAHRHVFEQLGRRAEEPAVDHVAVVRRHEDVARLQQPRAFGLRHAARPTSRAPASRAAITASSTRCLYEPSPISRNCASGDSWQIRGIAAASTSTPCQPPNVPVKPITRSDGVKPSSLRSAARSSGAGRRVDVGVGAVGIDQDLVAIDAARDQRVRRPPPRPR